MPEIHNQALDRLKRGEVALGCAVRLARTTEIAKMLKASGYDWLLIDLEHGSLALEVVSQISISAADNGITPFVRVPTGQWGMAACALDGGAQGILMPHVESVEEAQAAVEHLRFPPIGHRATLAGLPQYNYLPVDVQQVSREVNASTLIGLMIESPRGVENADAIAAIEGVDVLVIGINDLAQEMGLPGQLDHPKVVEACRKVVEATSRRGKFVGTGGIRDLALMHRYIDMGFQFILGGNDFAFMMTAASAHASAIRGES